MRTLDASGKSYERHYTTAGVRRAFRPRAASGSPSARPLGLAPASPVLYIDRVAAGMDGSRVDWRMTRCDTRRLKYLVTLT